MWGPSALKGKLPAREQGPLVDKTKFISKGVRAVETALAPGLDLNRSEDFGARLFAHTSLVPFEIFYSEI